MPARKSAVDQSRYFALRHNGHNVTTAARLIGIDRKTAASWEAGAKNSSGGAWAERERLAKMVGPIPKSRLSREAGKAWNDFGYFRRRYFGRIATPWQEDAAYKFEAYLHTPEKEYVVLNCPPGAGKSTLLHDIEAWLTVRNRAIRGILGSSTQRLAVIYCRRLRRTLERKDLVKGEPAAVAAGRALDAKATLVADFGRFEPDTMAEIWTNEQFVVAQHGDFAIEEKEATWAAFGLDAGYLGTRVEIAVWDDVVTKKSMRTAEAVETQRGLWDDEAEPRIEPGGLLALVGQRLGPEDLYRYCLDKADPAALDEMDDDDELVEPHLIEPEGLNRPRLYRHIVYPAHDEAQCKQEHKPKVAKYWPEGCLLDPVRLSWRELKSKSEEKFRIVYQQEDVDPQSQIVPLYYITGGDVNGIHYPGCYDKDRGLYDVPKNLNPEAISVLTVDPSPTRFWAVQWWIYDPASELRFLLDNTRRKMDAADFLDWNYQEGTFTGHLEEIWQIAHDRGRAFTHLIVERNGAQRFLLRLDYFQRWATLRGVSVHPHDTHANKTDEDFGVQTIAPHYQYGRYRLPNKATRGDFGFMASKRLVDEVTKWPHGATDDCVMAQWFFEYWIHRIATPDLNMRLSRRPSWMRRPA